MNLLFVTSECVPFAKTGGLADVSGALPSALADLGVNVVVAMPFYDVITGTVRQEGMELVRGEIRLGSETVPFSTITGRLPESDVTMWFIDCPSMFHRGAMYTGDPDEADRFIVLQRAALQTVVATEFRPDIVHSNDWHAALLPAMLKQAAREASENMARNTNTRSPAIQAATVLSVHNAAYQGTFPPETVQRAGLIGISEHPSFSFLRAGIEHADRIVAVSPTYAREIMTPEYGHGLEDAFRARQNDVSGILNGIDVDSWDPTTDPHLPQRFGTSDLTGKSKCRSALLDEFSLDPGTGPLMGVVSRLAWQKGLDLLIDALGSMLDAQDGALVILGSGDPDLESSFRALALDYPDRIAFTDGYDESLAHRIEAGADVFLMPSRYEPCGLNQMYSLRYGTLPLVRRTGGLTDTVIDAIEHPGAGNGFIFDTADAPSLLACLKRMHSVWQNQEIWAAIQERGMTADFSWDRSARAYLACYRTAQKETES